MYIHINLVKDLKHHITRWLVMTLFLLLLLTACGKKENAETTLAETVAGGTETVILDGTAVFETTGTPITDEEILPLIQMEKDMGMLPEGGYVSGCGYYYVSLTKNALDYSYCTVPIINDGKLWGEISFRRQEDGSVKTARVAEFGQESELNRILSENPGKSFVLVLSQYSEYAIMEDNTVYRIYGAEAEIVNGEKLFAAFNLEDNLISDRVFDKDTAIVE